MKVKKEYIFLIIIIVALSAYVIMRNGDKTHYRLPILPEIAGKDISKIEISKKGGTLILQRKDEDWYMQPEGYRADKDKAKKIEETIGKLKLTTLVSESKNYRRYELDEEKKIKVKAWKGDTLIRNFEVGKAASSYRHTFVKIADNKNVYHALENFRSKLEHTAEDLRDKTVLSFEKNEIHEIQIKKGEKAFVLTKKVVPVQVNVGADSETKSSPPPQGETLWTGEDEKTFDDSKINRLLSTLSNLRCKNYLNNNKKTDFKAPIFTITLKGAGQYTLSIYPKKNKDVKEFPAVSSENDTPFLLPEWQADNIMKDQDEFVKKPQKE